MEIFDLKTNYAWTNFNQKKCMKTNKYISQTNLVIVQFAEAVFLVLHLFTHCHHSLPQLLAEGSQTWLKQCADETLTIIQFS